MIGTVSSDEKAEIAKAHGCTHTIVTSRENIAQRVREITDGKGVPVVYDSVGKDTLQASLDSLQPRGTLVSNGTPPGRWSSTRCSSPSRARSGSRARRWCTTPRRARTCWRWPSELFGLVLAGKITGEPKQIFALAEAAEAHRALESRATTGATVLVP